MTKTPCKEIKNIDSDLKVEQLTRARKVNSDIFGPMFALLKGDATD